MDELGTSSTAPITLRSRAVAFVRAHERRLSSAMFVAGFFADALTLPRIDMGATYLLLSAYLVLAMAGIVGVVLLESGRLRDPRLAKIAAFAPPLVQLIFGAIFSALFVYYSRSGSLAGSWPFLALVLLAIVGNELLHDRFKRLEFRLASFFFVLMMTMIFAIPMALRELGVVPFLSAIALSLTFFSGFVSLLGLLAPEMIRGVARRVTLISVAIALALNALYFTHLIPPIPLVLKDASAYLSVDRASIGYVGVEERQTILARLGLLRKVYHASQGGELAFFTAVFAPTEIRTRIIHEWQHEDPATGDWETESTIGFPISGGRDEGYRGYTVKGGVTPGLWRVNVRTERGELLGREVFRVEETTGAVEKKEIHL